MVHREVWNETRQLPDPAAAKKFKGARWILLENPEDLTDDQAATLRSQAQGRPIWRAGLPPQGVFHAVFADGPDADEAGEARELTERRVSKAQREPHFGGHSTFGVSGPSHSPAAVMGS
ncbi:hypothetical protein AB0I52_07030 [Streptomyces sp. NPDC050423]|uniref:hypothetical protein n=1 Tax=Streptomyces sp. NPDC050423 TaxID=3155402 RepID=UPI00343B9370